MGDRFLVAVDFSRLTVPTVSYAVKLATGARHPIDLVHVLAGATGSAVSQTAAKELLDPLSRAERDGAQRRLQDLMHELVPVALQGEAIVTTGFAAQAINHIAATPGRYEMVVVSTHGRTGLQKVLLGSVAERVVRDAPIPVLVVRNP